MVTIRIGSKVPIVEQLVAGIRCAIARGELKVESTLPTVRQLAGHLEINQNTVARAYRALEASGLVTTTRGRGTFVVADRDDRRKAAAEIRAELVLRLQHILADCRLAGFDRSRIMTLMSREMNSIWPELGT